MGGQAPSTLGMDALLDFDVRLTLEERRLSRKEINALLASTEGLVLIKGRWVEVDKDKLGQVLDQWRAVQQQARAGGVSFGEAMRMLAGAGLDDGAADGSEDARPEWSEVIAGPWLSSRLDTLRAPELRAEIDADAGLRAELRSYQKLGVQWLWTLRGLELGGCLADDTTPATSITRCPGPPRRPTGSTSSRMNSLCSAARDSGESSASSFWRFFAPAYSSSARPSGRCWGLACFDTSCT